MDHIDSLEEALDSLEFKIESMNNQIQLMWKYIGPLEDAAKELTFMLNKYHDDECSVCDRAYKAHDTVMFQGGVFRGASMIADQKRNWIFETE
tara:strand:- start:211 stop:489 length:279 start_codon:yes stop_codon:yes gene_type:complete